MSTTAQDLLALVPTALRDDESDVIWGAIATAFSRVIRLYEAERDALPDLIDATDCPAAFLPDLAHTVGYSPDLRLRHRYEALVVGVALAWRRLISTSPAVWARKWEPATIGNYVRATTGARAWIGDWFDFRTVVGVSTLPFFATQSVVDNGDWWLDIHVEDFAGGLDRDIAEDALDLIRAGGERINVAFVDFVENFNEGLDRYSRSGAVTARDTDTVANGGVRLGHGQAFDLAAGAEEASGPFEPFDANTDWTLALRFRQDVVAAAWIWEWSDGTALNRIAVIAFATQLRLQITIGGVSVLAGGVAAITNGVWHLGTLQHDAATNTFRLWRENVLSLSGSYVGTFPVMDQLTLGLDVGLGIAPFTGLIGATALMLGDQSARRTAWIADPHHVFRDEVGVTNVWNDGGEIFDTLGAVTATDRVGLYPMTALNGASLELGHPDTVDSFLLTTAGSYATWDHEIYNFVIRIPESIATQLTAEIRVRDDDAGAYYGIRITQGLGPGNIALLRSGPVVVTAAFGVGFDTNILVHVETSPVAGGVQIDVHINGTLVISHTDAVPLVPGAVRLIARRFAVGFVDAFTIHWWEAVPIPVERRILGG